MTARRLRLVAPAGPARRLDQVVAETLPAALGARVSRRRVRRLIEAGAVYVDRRRTRIASRPVPGGTAIEVWLEPDGPEPERDARPAAPILAVPNLAVPILYLDRHLIAVDKPAGLPVQATVTDAVGHLLAATAATLGAIGEEAAGLRLQHRLDRGTSGVVLFARDAAASQGLGPLFASGGVEKVYRALVAPRPGIGVPAAWTVADRLDRLRDRPGARARTVAVASGGREAVTDFRLLERRPELALVEARPRTGRTHQIRAHLAGGGFPVVGDRLYGRRRSSQDGGRPSGGRLWLHAERLALAHPVTGQPLVIESPPPIELLATAERAER